MEKYEWPGKRLNARVRLPACVFEPYRFPFPARLHRVQVAPMQCTLPRPMPRWQLPIPRHTPMVAHPHKRVSP
jgi:hypothetical protein